MNARDVDHDARASVGQEALDRLSRAQESAAEVHRQDLVEVRAGKLLGRSRDLDAGVVDQDVEAAETLGHLVDHPHDVLLGRNVALDQHVADALLPDHVHTRVHLRLRLGGLVGRRR